jgi:putative sugar O-methyltransferase
MCLLDSITEPKEGNPYVIEYDTKYLTQDLLNSICEFYSSTECFHSVNDIQNVAEIGSGYGRTAYVFLHTIPKCTYTIIDIPIALYTSEKYLSVIFDREKIFRFRHFESYREIANEFESSRIRFITPNQLDFLPDKKFDLFINISSFHEMNYNQIEYYFNQINRLCRGMVYIKQWNKSKHYTKLGALSLKNLLTELSIIKKTKYSNYTISQNDYPYPKSWVKKYKRRHPVQTLFFEALYKT